MFLSLLIAAAAVQTAGFNPSAFFNTSNQFPGHTHLMFHLHYKQVNAYRSMLHNDMMVGAFSHSTAVGKLRQELPDVPSDARLIFPRYTLDEAETVCHYYMRYFFSQKFGIFLSVHSV